MNQFLGSLLLVSLALPLPFAAFAANDDDSIIEEIVVSATRRDVPVMDIPQSIQAVTADVLELPSYTEMNQVYNLVPGATTFSNKQPPREGIQLRGSGISQSNAADGISPVGYYVDDIPYMDLSTPVPPPIGTFDLDRVEIIRGPQGTSYGQDSSGGSVILRTAPVDLEKFGYKVRAGVTDVKDTSGTGHRIGGVVNMPVAEGVFGVRVSYLREYDPGYGEVATRPDIDNPLESTRDSLRIKALWQATDRLSFEATHSQWNTDYGFLAGTQIMDSSGGEMILNPTTTPMLLEVFPDGELENEYEISWTTLKAQLELDFADLVYSVGYVDTPKKETNAEFQFDLGFGPLSSASVFNQPAESLTQELRIVSNADSKLRWLGGLFYMDAESNSEGFTQTPAFFISERVSDPIEAEAWAAYGEIEYDINDQWGVLAGLRYHDEERVYTTEYALGFTGEPTFGPFSLPSPTTVQKRNFDHFSYRLGVTWQPTDNGLVYLTRSTANRAPIVVPQSDLIVLQAAGVQPPGDTDASALVNTELGTKWTAMEGRLQAELVYAYVDWQDIPIWAAINVPPSPVSVPIGGTDAVVEIWELAVSMQFNETFSASYAAAFTDSEVKSIPGGASIASYPAAVRDGGELFNYAPVTHNLNLRYDQQLDNDWGVFASVNYVYREKADGINVFDFAATDYLPADDDYVDSSLNLGARKGPWTVTLSVNNLTNHDGMYLPSSEDSVGGFFALIQPPRSMTLQVTFDQM
ncbi:MAG: TonB-dependent receptor [bacterium]